MNSKKVFFGMLGLTILLVGLAAATLVIGDLTLGKQAKKLLDLRLEDKFLDEQQAALIRASKEIEQYQELEQVSKSVVPQDKDQARAVREIVRIANDSGIKIGSITFPNSNLGSKPQATTSNPDAPGEKTAPTQSPVSQAKAVEGISGVYALEMTIIPDAEQPITYNQFLKFLKRLENNRRTAQVTSAKIDPVGTDPNSSYISFTLTINIFVKP